LLSPADFFSFFTASSSFFFCCLVFFFSPLGPASSLSFFVFSIALIRPFFDVLFTTQRNSLRPTPTSLPVALQGPRVLADSRPPLSFSAHGIAHPRPFSFFLLIPCFFPSPRFCSSGRAKVSTIIFRSRRSRLSSASVHLPKLCMITKTLPPRPPFSAHFGQSNSSINSRAFSSFPSFKQLLDMMRLLNSSSLLFAPSP